MEFDFSINALFRDSICVITGDTRFSDKRGRYGNDRELEDVVNTVGERSAKAQKLSSPITTWSRLKINGQKIYLLANRTANNGQGHVLGFIKVGQKQLFVLDRDGKHNEMHPLCVLDFYIHESQQRKGHGLKLFKYMLEAENVEPAHLAIDRPSSKFISFLRKHFHLWAIIPQVNNFVVFDGFFKNRKDKKRHVRQKNRDFEDDFRPLSRAFSEDVIKRNRGNNSYDYQSLNGVRPMSGLVTNGSGDYSNSRFPNSRQGVRGNRFSRFAVDENSYVPSSPQNRRRSLKTRQEEEIVTNPYRRVTNSMGTAGNRETMNQVENSNGSENNPRPLHEIQQVDIEEHETRDKGSSIVHAYYTHESREGHSKDQNTSRMGQGRAHQAADKVEYARNHSIVSPLESQEVDTKNENGRSNPSQENLFQAKIGYNSIRSTQYSKPSDMILELKHKDQQTSNRPNASRQHLNTSYLGTSWNVFGVPTLPRRQWPNP